mgnify:CR=1 FL=1
MTSNGNDNRDRIIDSNEELSDDSSSMGSATRSFLIDDDSISLPFEVGSLEPDSGGHVPIFNTPNRREETHLAGERHKDSSGVTPYARDGTAGLAGRAVRLPGTSRREAPQPMDSSRHQALEEQGGGTEQDTPQVSVDRGIHEEGHPAMGPPLCSHC